MTAPEKNSPIQEQESLTLIFALTKLRLYLFELEKLPILTMILLLLGVLTAISLKQKLDGLNS